MNPETDKYIEPGDLPDNTDKAKTPPITQQEMTPQDIQHAKSLAVKLGYGDNTAYTSSSSMIGVFCLDSPGKNGGCIIKTDEFGFMFVQLEEDLQG